MRWLPIALLSGLLLTACAAPGLGSGLTTELGPGESLTVVARGDDPELLVSSEGPGEVVVTREALPGFVIRLGARGVTVATLRGGGTFRVTNDSSARALLTIRTSGADAVEIHGPVVPPPPTAASPPGADRGPCASSGVGVRFRSWIRPIFWETVRAGSARERARRGEGRPAFA